MPPDSKRDEARLTRLEESFKMLADLTRGADERQDTMRWAKRGDRNESLKYSADLKSFLLNNLSEESVFIAVYPISHSSA